MTSQMKLVEDSHGVKVSAVTQRKANLLQSTQEQTNMGMLELCGQRHEFQRKELCPVYGETCTKCTKLNHFADKCRSRVAPASV